MNLTRKQVRVTGAILLVIATIAAAIFAIIPALSALQNPAELVALQRTNSQLTSQLEGVRQAQAQFNTAQDTAENLEQQFPAAANVPQVTQLVAAAANDAGFSSGDVTNLTFQNPATATATAGTGTGTSTGTGAAPSASAGATPQASTSASYATQNVEITLRGGNESRYAAFLRALTAYGQEKRVFTVNGFSVSGSAAGAGGSGKQLVVTVVAYLHPSIPTPGATQAAPQN